MLRTNWTMKKGQGLSLNVIIIAALALIVLIVLTVIFTGRVSLFNKGVSTCNGFCSKDPSACEARGAVAIPTKGCTEAGASSPSFTDEGYCCLG